VQQGPRGIAIPIMAVTAAQARRPSGDDEGADGDASAFERHGQMRDVLSQMARELQRSGGSGNQHDRHRRGAADLDQANALVCEGLPHAVFAAGVRDTDALHPRGPGRGRIVEQHRL